MCMCVYVSGIGKGGEEAGSRVTNGADEITRCKVAGLPAGFAVEGAVQQEDFVLNCWRGDGCSHFTSVGFHVSVL
jgi:hypothetical protein